MPSPSSPPTMLKPRPVEPLCRMILRGSLVGKQWKGQNKVDMNWHPYEGLSETRVPITAEGLGSLYMIPCSSLSLLETAWLLFSARSKFQFLFPPLFLRA